jgi:hypothetical protein
VNLLGNDIRVGENTRADDPTHHDHRGVEKPEPAGEIVSVGICLVVRWIGH